MLSKTIYLIRHGKIELEDDKRTYIGQIDVPLSVEGHKQAQALTRKLSHLKIEGVFCSDLSRSLNTAEPIAAEKGLVAQSREDLREISLGHWEGLKFAEIARRYPREFKERGADIGFFRPPGGESFADCSIRVLAAFNDIIQSPYENIAIVGHAGVNRLLICHMLGMPLANIFRIVQDYACINIILTGNFGYRIKALNY